MPDVTAAQQVARLLRQPAPILVIADPGSGATAMVRGQLRAAGYQVTSMDLPGLTRADALRSIQTINATAPRAPRALLVEDVNHADAVTAGLVATALLNCVHLRVVAIGTSDPAAPIPTVLTQAPWAAVEVTAVDALALARGRVIASVGL